MKEKGCKKCVCIIVWIMCIIGIIGFFWSGLRPLLPWEKTRFSKHEDFIEVLEEYYSMGSWYMLKELPASAEKTKYYWYIRLNNEMTAYSMCLDEEDYEQVIAERRTHYEETLLQRGVEKNVYTYETGAPFYVENSELHEKELKFIEKVVCNPSVKEQYYFLFINSYGNHEVHGYYGVILNDTTQEVIEFNVQVMEEAAL